MPAGRPKRAHTHKAPMPLAHEPHSPRYRPNEIGAQGPQVHMATCPQPKHPRPPPAGCWLTDAHGLGTKMKRPARTQTPPVASWSPFCSDPNTPARQHYSKKNGEATQPGLAARGAAAALARSPIMGVLLAGRARNKQAIRWTR